LSQNAIEEILSLVQEGEGMRNVEKYVEHVISSAHLCKVLEVGPVSVGLAKDVVIYSDSGEITGDFARGVLAQLVSTKAPPPPFGMYT
jgi:hypothetical protein